MKIVVSMVFFALLVFAKEDIMSEFLESGFGVKHSFHCAWNDKNIKLTRFTKDEGLNFGKEHISFVYDENENLMAMARVLKKYDKKHQFSLSKNQAQDIALDFFKKYSPEILENFKILWIDFHDEVIKEIEKTTITGLKVKCQNLNDKKYFWAIVGFDGSVIIFEKDVIWDFLKAGRQTQKWIHDSWLKKEIQ